MLSLASTWFARALVAPLRRGRQRRPPALSAGPSAAQATAPAEALGALLDSDVVGMAVTDASGQFLAANERLRTLLGLDAEALRALRLADVMRVAERSRLDAPLAALRDGRSRRERLQGRCRRGDGTWFWADISLAPLPGSTDRRVCVIEDLTELRRAQDESRELALLVDGATDFIAVAALSGQMRYVNAAGRRMTGMRADAPAHTTTLLDFITMQDHAQYRGEILPTLLVTGVWEGEARLRHLRTGAMIPMWHHAFLIRDPGHEHPAAMALISRNLTDRRRAQSELLALKNELAVELAAMKRLHELGTRLLSIDGLQPLLDEVLNCLIVLLNADCGHVQFYDREHDRLDLVTQRNLLGELLAPCTAVRDANTPCGQAMRRKTRVIIEDLRRAADLDALRPLADAGGVRAALSLPLFARDGALLGMLTLLFARVHRPSEHELQLADLCARQAAQLIERKQVETALQRSEACLAAGESLSRSGSWAWHLASGELYWSHEHFLLFGLDPAAHKPTPENCFDNLVPDDRDGVRQLFRDAIAERRSLQLQFRIVRADGEVRHMQGLSHPIFDAAGRLTDYVGTVADITERKRSEEALARAHGELAQLTRVMSMGELAASVAHEVNQPLAAIVTNGQACLRWLNREMPNLEEARAAAERAVRDGIRAGAVIQRIRALSARAASNTAWLDLNEVVQQAVQLAQTEVQRHAPALRLELAERLPPVRGDRIQLQQVVLNLMRNGMEAMQAVNDRLRMLVIRSRIASAERGAAGVDQVVIDVSDSGLGLEPGTAERLFDAFFTTKAEGMGLGLAISRRILDAHGGRLWMTPNRPHGVTVSFAVPAGHPEA